MRNIYMLAMLIVIFSGSLNSQVFASNEPTDIVLDESENAVYVIKGIYQKLLKMKKEKDSLKVIYKINIKDNSKEAYYTNDSNMDRLILSPNNKYIAVMTGAFSSGSGLLIIDKNQRKEQVRTS